jgi:hypothetical protein
MTKVSKAPTEEIQLSDVLAKVRRAYSPEIAEALRAELAVVASLSYADIPCCLALILEGPSGVGKSALIEMLNPVKEAQVYLRREDRFTAASFVSNAANKSTGALDKIDLLPRLKHKVMLTKELASIFGSDDKALRETFGIITNVLDGKGYRTASGTHGERGYEGDYRFNWIGATTPVPMRIHSIMAGFGYRFLFYECRFKQPDFEEIKAKMMNASSYSMQDECNALVNNFICQHFSRFPVKSIGTNDVECPDEVFKRLYDYAMLMTLGRRTVVFVPGDLLQNNGGAEGTYVVGSPEFPFRPLEMFRSISIGSALIAKRKCLSADDLKIVRHIALSSIPETRRAVLRSLIQAGGHLTSWETANHLKCSRPTALGRMKELAATEICGFHKNEPGSNEPDFITLNEEFRFLI